MIYLKDRVNYLNKKMLHLTETIMKNTTIESPVPQPTASAQGINSNYIS